MSFTIKPTWPSLRAAARALAHLDASLAAEEPRQATIAFHVLGFIPHGLLSFDHSGTRKVASFLAGRPIFGLFDASDHSALLAANGLAGILSWLFDDDEDEEGGEVDTTVWVKTIVTGGFLHKDGVRQ